MTTLMKYNAANLSQLLDRINRNSIGMEEYFDRVLNAVDASSNYPPYNVIQEAEGFTLELALAGFKKEEVNVYTESGKLFVEGQRDDSSSTTNYIHRGVAQRSFTRSWALAEDQEVGSVKFEDGLLTVFISKVIPEAHKRKDYL